MFKRTSSRIYPRGFMGPESSTAMMIDVAEKSLIETQVAGATTSIVINEKSNIKSDLAIVQLFREVEKDIKLLDDIMVKEHLYTIALKMFGPTLRDWLKSQTESKFFNKNHVEFLEDIIRYSLEDGRMSLYVSQWEVMLSGNNKETIPAPLSDKLKNCKASTLDFVQGFLTKADGVTTLLRVLWIMYGEDERANYLNNRIQA